MSKLQGDLQNNIPSKEGTRPREYAPSEKGECSVYDGNNGSNTMPSGNRCIPATWFVDVDGKVHSYHYYEENPEGLCSWKGKPVEISKGAGDSHNDTDDKITQGKGSHSAAKSCTVRFVDNDGSVQFYELNWKEPESNIKRRYMCVASKIFDFGSKLIDLVVFCLMIGLLVASALVVVTAICGNPEASRPK